MVYDDVIVGSGLTALATAIGLPAGRKLLVLAGPQAGIVKYYDRSNSVPRSYLGFGGLGNFWHGVIPIAARADYAQEVLADFRTLFAYFYPSTNLDERLPAPWLFVPRKPIRSRAAWARLSKVRGDNLTIAYVHADRFERIGGQIQVSTPQGHFRGHRLWIAAGALDTPMLLEVSLGLSLARSHVSDHVICYAGQLDARAHQHLGRDQVAFVPGGFLLRAHFDGTSTALFTLKPARFDYKVLDWGIEQRAAFGLQTGSAITKIVRAKSLGLLSEAVFNRFGLFPSTKLLSVYAQIAVRDAFEFERHDRALKPNLFRIMQAINAVRAPGTELRQTKRPDLFINGVHLHHTVDLAACASSGLCDPTSPIKIVDASILSDVGPEHHSFFTMARAHKAARLS